MIWLYLIKKIFPRAKRLLLPFPINSKDTALQIHHSNCNWWQVEERERDLSLASSSSYVFTGMGAYELIKGEENAGAAASQALHSSEDLEAGRDASQKKGKSSASAVATRNRLVSLDVFRGLTVAVRTPPDPHCFLFGLPLFLFIYYYFLHYWFTKYDN